MPSRGCWGRDACGSRPNRFQGQDPSERPAVALHREPIGQTPVVPHRVVVMNPRRHGPVRVREVAAGFIPQALALEQAVPTLAGGVLVGRGRRARTYRASSFTPKLGLPTQILGLLTRQIDDPDPGFGGNARRAPRPSPILPCHSDTRDGGSQLKGAAVPTAGPFLVPNFMGAFVV